MNIEQRTATIHPFPNRLQTSAGAGRPQNRPVAELRSLRPIPVTYCGGWYHDEAIEDERRNGKH